MKREKSIILFMSPGCGACVRQEQILDNYFRSKGKSITISKINIDRFPNKFKFIKFTPTWAFSQGNQKYALYPGGIEDPSMIENMSRKSHFGSETLLPNINDLAFYGKNFPDGKGFNTTQSFYGNIENTWGTGDDTLNAGIGGTRSLGPDNIGEMYSNGYLNNIRMAHPSDQLGTALNLNRSCNKTTNVSSPGLIFDSPNPQIVSTGFGRKQRFGNLNMGPAIESQYLISKDTGNELYSGARQNENTRPYSVKSNTYIGQAPVYNPIGESKSFASFGKKKIGEGSVLKIKNGKVKVKR